MRTGIRLHLAHFIVLSSRALIPDTTNQEFFCLRTKSEPGRTQCSFLRRPSAVASVLFYWTIWTAEHRVEECSVSAEPALIQSYMSVCHERGIWDLHKTSSLRLDIVTLLLEAGSPCEFRPISLANLKWHRYLDTGYQMGSATRMRQKRAWILPGTLWCGRGSRAGDYEQLGMFERVDRCCREHDHCDHIIRPFTVNFGVFNPTLFTISHCDCDHRFKQCLLKINDTVSNMVGYTFYNILKVQCFELIQKRRCTKINWIGMCTSDKVAPYAILKHTTIYNATTSNAGIPEPPVCEGNPSASTKQKNMKLKERKQLTSRKNYVPGYSAAEKTFLLSEIIGQPNGRPKTISPTSTTEQPNYMMRCNTTLFHQKSDLITNQSTPFPEAASTSHVHTTTSIASSKRMVTPSKKITPNKSKNITQWPITGVQSKLTKIYKPLKSKLNSDPPRGDRFQPKQQRGKSGKQDNSSLHSTLSPIFITLSLASKFPRTNKLFESMPQTNSPNSPSKKKTSNAVSSRSHPQNSSTLEMKHKSTEVTKQAKTWNNTNSAYKTFKPTG
ncbi:group 3 secretory phospholipase A2 isoform X3 [Ictalurus punctatus]|uniref:phospholipase A2 n=1 Tax=Ictalurus punctatus TaxID=7998 RepID=A0A979EDF4_ICTPU|nr:group 3 secretory phospholipase A2 isoform X3 [Ictalurus punctatus]